LNENGTETEFYLGEARMGLRILLIDKGAMKSSVSKVTGHGIDRHDPVLSSALCPEWLSHSAPNLIETCFFSGGRAVGERN